MRSRAAVACEAGKPLVIEKVEVAGPKNGDSSTVVSVITMACVHNGIQEVVGSTPIGSIMILNGLWVNLPVISQL